MKPRRSLVALVVMATALVPVSPPAAQAKVDLHPCVVTDDPGVYIGRDHRPKRKQLPETFTPVRAFFCVDDLRLIPGRGRWAVLLGRQATGSLSELTTALRQPDEPPPVQSSDPGAPIYACPASLIVAPTIVLYSGSGKAFRPRIPLNWCGQPQEGVGLALAHLHTTTVQVLLRHQFETPAQVALDQRAAKLGCPTAFKDLFALGALPHLLSHGGAISRFPATVSVCRFQPGESSNAFVSGRRLTKAQTTALRAASSLPGKPGGCAKPHTGTLVVSWRYGFIEAEIGGCSRVIRQEGASDTLGRADPAALAKLTPS